MATPPLSQSVSDFRTMAGGITTRLDILANVGITAADAEAMNNFANELDILNSQQEALKAQLKIKTDELYARLRQAQTKHADLRKRVKIATPQEHWVAFGITAKR